MLSGLGETAIENLEEPLSADIAQALMILNKTIEEIQLSDWYFNTEENATLLPDNNGDIWLPADVHRISIIGYGNKYIRKGNKIYDTDKGSYNINRKLKALLTRILPFDEMPLTFQHYSAIRAARKFQNNILGSTNIRSFQEKDEMEAKLACMKEEQTIRKPNIQYGGGNIAILNGWSVAKTLKR